MTSFSAAFPNGVSSGDVTQTSAVVWTRAVQTGRVTFQIATDASFRHVVDTEKVFVTDPFVPAKVEFDHLRPDQEYFIRVIDASGDVIKGSFETAAKLGDHDGFHFGVVADLHGELAPYPAIKNAAGMDLDLVIKLGDTVTADLPTAVPGILVLNDGTLATYQQIHNAEYSAHFGANFLADLQAKTPILAIHDDHELLDDYAGGASLSTDARFPSEVGADFINETSFYKNAMKAFSQYNAIEDRSYHGTGDDRFDGAPDFYRYNTYGSDAAIITVDARSFRDAELAHLQDVPVPFPNIPFLAASFTPGRSMLGELQLDRLKGDLLDARDKGITWKFITLPEAIQNFGPIIRPGDRYEGYAAERNELLKFIDQNHIENVVFITADTHWTSVNNLTYQEFFGGPQIATSAIDINMLSAGAESAASLIPAAAAALGVIPPEAVAFYNSLPVAPDTDDLPNDKDDFVKGILNGVISALKYDPIGLDDNLPAAAGKVNATLLQGDYFIAHNLGWTDFDVDATTGKLLVTTHGITPYAEAELVADPAAILSRTPAIVGQFEVTPTSDSIIGTARHDRIRGTSDDDVILGADGKDNLQGRDGDDYLDGGEGNDEVRGGSGNDRIFGRDGNDKLKGEAGDDLIDGGSGHDKLFGGAGDDTLIGGLGGDWMTGGTGNDNFLFATPLNASNNVDKIGGYVVADDTIQLDNAVFTALTTTGTLSANHFRIGSGAADADDFVIYNSATGALYYDADGNGSGAKVKFAALNAGLALTNSDFVVV